MKIVVRPRPKRGAICIESIYKALEHITSNFIKLLANAVISSSSSISLHSVHIFDKKFFFKAPYLFDFLNGYADAVSCRDREDIENNEDYLSRESFFSRDFLFICGKPHMIKGVRFPQYILTDTRV